MNKILILHITPHLPGGLARILLSTLKFYNKENSLFLLSANSDYPSIEVKEEMECFIWGVVTYVIHESNS